VSSGCLKEEVHLIQTGIGTFRDCLSLHWDRKATRIFTTISYLVVVNINL